MKHAPSAVFQPPSSPVAAPLAGERLRGRRILVPAHQELDRLAAMIANESATAFRCPLRAMLDPADQEAVDGWVRVLASGRFDLVIFLSEEGVVRLVDSAARLGIKDDFLEALRRASVVTRGPRPACALYELGVPVDVRSTLPTVPGVIDGLRRRDLARRHVGVQLIGDDPARELKFFLVGARAFVHGVAPYRHAPASAEDQVLALIEHMGGGGLDAIVFTDTQQVERVLDVADRRGARGHLTAGLARVLVAARGADVADRLERSGAQVDIVAPPQFFTRRLLEGLVTLLGPAP
jgi:uroporphyrinogen-III synthase